jgi:hypothetical protein
VIRAQLAAEELGLAGDAESGALLGVLRARSKLAHLLTSRTNNYSSSTLGLETSETCLEGVLLQSHRQARNRFVSGAGLRDDGEAGGRAIVVSRSDLDTGDGRGLVRRRWRCNGREPALRKPRSSLTAKSQLAAPRQSRSADHGWGARCRQLTLV